METALAPLNRQSGENPYTLQQDLQAVMGDLVGIIRRAGELTDALKRLQELKLRVANVGAIGGRKYNPGWHLALDLRNMLVVSECTAKAALEREESRGGHTREDFPKMDPALAADQPGLLAGRLRRGAGAQAGAEDARRAAQALRPHRAEQVPDRRRTRGLSTLWPRRRSNGCEAPLPRLAGRLVRRRGPGLRRRGQRGRGRPRHHPPAAGDADAGPRLPVELQGRQVRLLLDGDQRHAEARLHDADVHLRGERDRHDHAAADLPGHPRPGHRRLVQLREGARDARVRAAGRASQPGEYRMQQVDVERSQEFRKCIECFLCQNTCHVVRDHEENKKAFSGPRFFIRAAELDMHPLDARTDRKDYAAGAPGPRLLQHHEVLHRGVPRAHQDHRQRDHPDEGTRRRQQVRPAGLAGPQDLPPRPAGEPAGAPRRARAARTWRRATSRGVTGDAAGTPFSSARPPIGPARRTRTASSTSPNCSSQQAGWPVAVRRRAGVPAADRTGSSYNHPATARTTTPATAVTSIERKAAGPRPGGLSHGCPSRRLVSLECRHGRPGYRAPQTRAHNTSSGRRCRIRSRCVGHLGAMQAQEFPYALWSVAQRTTGVGVADVRKLVDDGALVRTHALRPTWHLLAPEDLGWIQALTGPRVHAFNAYYYRQVRHRRGVGGADQHADHRCAARWQPPHPQGAGCGPRCGRIPGGRHQAGVRRDACRARRTHRQRADARQAAHVRAGRGTDPGSARADRRRGPGRADPPVLRGTRTGHGQGLRLVVEPDGGPDQARPRAGRCRR